MIYLFIIPVLILLAWLIVIYNRLVRDRNRVKTAWSDIDVQLKRRYDLIPKLVSAVEQYARYEQSTLQTIIEVRSRASQVEKADEKAPLENLLASGLGKLMALVEDYPELKADRSFLQLQNDLSDIENHIQYARRYYNGAVRNLNTRVETFPDLIVARPFGFTPQPFFELDSADESKSPEIF